MSNVSKEESLEDENHLWFGECFIFTINCVVFNALADASKQRVSAT